LQISRMTNNDLSSPEDSTRVCDNADVGTLVDVSSDRPLQSFLKRAIDVVGSAFLIIVLAPLFILLAVIIQIIDGAPIIYRRRVVGRIHSFDAYKFRTMCREADAMLASDLKLRMAYAEQFKLKADPRITRLGAWLRKYSLDELPQLFNVVKGQMSLVGPRMITFPELEKYGPYQRLLRTVKPGLTGYWQVEGRQDVSYAERVRMDVYYITHWSLLLDFMILLKTPTRVILGQGAY